MANDSFEFLKDVLAAPLGEMIASVGEGVGEAQAALDAGSLAQTLELYTGTVGEDPSELLELMRAIGYQPTFYSLPNTKVKAKISLAISNQQITSTNPSLGANGQAKRVLRMYASPNNAANTNRYNLNVNASTELEFTIVPVPPPTGVSSLRKVPDVRNEPLSDVQDLLDNLGIPFAILSGSDGTGAIVNAQSILPPDFINVETETLGLDLI